MRRAGSDFPARFVRVAPLNWRGLLHLLQQAGKRSSRTVFHCVSWTGSLHPSCRKTPLSKKPSVSTRPETRDLPEPVAPFQMRRRGLTSRCPCRISINGFVATVKILILERLQNPSGKWKAHASFSSAASTCGSRTSTQRPWISNPAKRWPAASIALIASVNSYSPRGDFCSLAVKSNNDGLKM